MSITQTFVMMNWWWFVFEEWLINKGMKPFFSQNHCQSSTCCKQDLNLHRTWVCGMKLFSSDNHYINGLSQHFHFQKVRSKELITLLDHQHPLSKMVLNALVHYLFRHNSEWFWKYMAGRNCSNLHLLKYC